MGRRWTPGEIRAEAERRRLAENVEPMFYLACTAENVEGLLSLPLADGARVEVESIEEVDRGMLALYGQPAVMTFRVVDASPPPPPAPADRPTVAPKPPLDREVE